MTATRTLYRRANVSAADATRSIFKRFPNADLVSFTKKEATAEEAKAARAQKGELVFEAKIRLAEFPPSEGEDSEAPEPKEEKGDKAPAESPDKDTDADIAEEADAEGESFEHEKAEKAEGDHDDGGLEPKKLSPEEQIIHLLTQLLDAVKGGGEMGHKPPMGHGGPPGGPELGGDLPDIGAPGAGEELPPPGGHGGPPGAGGPPLPPPVKEKSPIGAGAFASVTGKSEVMMVREDANEIGNKAIIAEAAQHAPKHRVAKIQRTGLAQIGNDVIDLAEAKLALVTLVSR